MVEPLYPQKIYCQSYCKHGNPLIIGNAPFFSKTHRTCICYVDIKFRYSGINSGIIQVLNSYLMHIFMKKEQVGTYMHILSPLMKILTSAIFKDFQQSINQYTGCASIDSSTSILNSWQLNVTLIDVTITCSMARIFIRR